MATAKCNCVGCNRLGEYSFPLARRGGGNAYLCERHYRYLEGYGTNNDALVGTPKKNGIMIGREFEMSYCNFDARFELIAQSAIPTRDGSLHDYSGRGKEVEFVFGTEYGLNKVSKDAVTIEKLVNAGLIEMNDTCGTHLHVSTTETRKRGRGYGMDTVRRFINTLFMPVSELMYNNRTATTALFGRFYTGYAPMMSWDYTCREGHNETRYMWVNATNSNRIEYRLVKFVSAKQYMACVKMCVKMTECISKNFIAHFNDTEIDSTRYENKTAYRKHKAEVTAKKLCDIYRKACKELGYDIA